MKILITHELFPPDVVGGGETLTYKIAKELINRGFDVKVLTSGNPRIRFYENIPTTRIPVNRYLMNLSFPLIKKHSKDVDLIHTSSGNMCLPSYLAAKVNKKPICCYIHHIFGRNWVYVRGFLLGKVFQAAERYFLTRDYDAIIFQNDLSLRIGLEMGIKKEKVFIVHPGIDWKEYDMSIEKKRQVLFVGSLSMDESLAKIKGLDYFIEAARLIPDVKFLVVGDVKKLRVDAPKNVVFMRAKGKEELKKIYNESLVFCKPSLAEGFGLTLLEAMASGCAIVSTIDIGQKGMLAKPGDAKELAEAIKYYLDNPEIAKRDGKENKKIAKRFTWKRFIDDLIKIYEYITSK
jgi:glycosyltransferase involved in cell wall biosynthesis